MQLQTKYFGPISCDEVDILHFPNGLFAFEEEKDYLLLPFEDRDSIMLCLQSVRTPDLAFVVMNPFALNPDYAPVLSGDELRQLGVQQSEELCYYTLCVVKKPVSNSTVNLRCPIAINDETHRAMQVILDTELYHMRHPLSEFSKESGADT